MSDRDELAALVNGRPLPVNPTTIGGIYERDTAYERADSIIAAGWRVVGGLRQDQPQRLPLR